MMIGVTARRAEEGRLREWMALAGRLEGVSLCPESAACLGVLEAEGFHPDTEGVLFNTAAAQKYVEALR